MVVFEKGKAKRSDYRKFRIQSVSGPDDYACMKEVLTRRFIHGMEEKEELNRKAINQEFGSFTKFPDLLLMDGGRGQVAVRYAPVSPALRTASPRTPPAPRLWNRNAGTTRM